MLCSCLVHCCPPEQLALYSEVAFFFNDKEPILQLTDFLICALHVEIEDPTDLFPFSTVSALVVAGRGFAGMCFLKMSWTSSESWNFVLPRLPL